MALEVASPESSIGDVVADLNSRRAKIQGIEMRNGVHVVNVQVPLAETFGYATHLRSMTQGRASYTMQFSHYEAVPQSLAEVIKGREG